jgi:RecB family exonuclease
VPVPPLHRVRRLSFTALGQFESCSYRYYAERIVGMRPTDERLAAPGTTGLAATEIGTAVHRLLELVDLRDPSPPGDLAPRVRGWYPSVTDEEIDRIAAFVATYCRSDLARRVARLGAAQAERSFAFEHDGVLLHGVIDVLQLDGSRAVVVDYKTNSLAEGTPEEIVEADYRLQRLVYALACFRAGADEVEVVYHFLERADAVVSASFTRSQVAELESELSAAIERINAGDFRPSPDEFVCAGCPALDVVCAGPRLRGFAEAAAEAVAAVS